MARILIVDDSLFIRTKIGEVVKNADYEVIGFASNLIVKKQLINIHNLNQI